MVMIACTVANNTIGDGDGGGVDQAGNYLVLKRSTISGNHLTGGNGGGLAVTPDSGSLVLIEDSTFTGNSTGGSGGGIYVGLRGASNPGIFSSTIAGNSAHTGGGIFVERPAGGSSRLDVAVSLVSGDTGGDCAAGVLLLSLGHNIAKDSTCPFTASGDRKGTDPKLGALAVSFPGETATLPLLAGSPAIDAGDDPATPTDQRGVPRAGAHPDVGAFEVADSAAVIVPVEEVELRLPEPP
jgi:predicted outer membrane repeat protein